MRRTSTPRYLPLAHGPSSRAARSAEGIANAIVRIEILTVEGCPHADATCELVRRAVSLEQAEAAVDLIDVPSAQAAQHLRFLGSPSVRVNGEDAEPAARWRTEYGLMCRSYPAGPSFVGTPPIELIRSAICRALGGRATSLEKGGN